VKEISFAPGFFPGFFHSPHPPAAPPPLSKGGLLIELFSKKATWIIR